MSKRMPIKSFLFVLLVGVSTVACKPRDHSTLQSQSAGSSPWERKFAMQLRPSDDGLLVSAFSAEELSPACTMGLQLGDRIKSLNGYKVASVADFQSAAESFLAKGSADAQDDSAHWCFVVERQGRSLRLPFDCNWGKVASDPQLKFFVQLCQPRSMYQCGVSPDQCQTHLRR